jgi:hypothetical protein
MTDCDAMYLIYSYLARSNGALFCYGFLTKKGHLGSSGVIWPSPVTLYLAYLNGEPLYRAHSGSTLAMRAVTRPGLRLGFRQRPRAGNVIRTVFQQTSKRAWRDFARITQTLDRSAS